MAKRIVRWTKTADIQYVAILEFWVQHNKSATYSKKLIHKVATLTKQIAITPFLFRGTEIENVRVASLGNFSIFYIIYQDEIIIVSFWDNRQNPEVLRQLLKNKGI